jgi:methionyl-tRNA formyltransferase
VAIPARRLRVAFFGTPEFAVPTLQRLIDGHHEVVAIVCQPDRKRGRGRKTSTAPVAEVALAAGIHLLRPERVGAEEVLEQLNARAPDLGVVVAFGQFLPKTVRTLPSLGYLINGHASLLPRHRGAAPIVHAILAGDTVSGVSAMRVEREMDAGPVALQRELEIVPGENSGELSARLSVLAADVLAEVIDQIADERVGWTPQDSALASYAPKIGRDEARLSWDESATTLLHRVLAMAPKPGAFTTLEGKELRILDGRALPETADTPPGVALNRSGELKIATGDGWLLPTVLQRPGKRALGTREYLRGNPIPDGAHLI